MPPADDHSPTRWPIAESGAGQRLDRHLVETIGVSRTQANALLDAGAVRVNGRVAKSKDKGRALVAGDVVETDADALLPAPSDAPLAVAAEGEGFLIADKPAGLPTHPLNPAQRDTLLNRVVARRPAVVGVGEGGLRSGVVHRLDVDTSGLVFFALSEERFATARAAFAGHAADKTYLAFVAGRVTEPRRVELPLAVVRHSPAHVEVVKPGEDPERRAWPAALSFRPVEAFASATLLEVRLETGFLHQIRVTLAHLGHPVLGDDRYGRPDPPAGRLMLHAAELRVGDAAATSQPPPAFQAVLDAHRRARGNAPPPRR